MSNHDVFLESVRKLLPEQAHLIDARAKILRDDPMGLLKDLMERSVMTKGRICQLWADSLGVAYVNPAT